MFKPPHEELPEDWGEEELERRRERVVLLRGGVVRGELPLGSVVTLELVARVDLDGDGAEELLWVSRANMPQLLSSIELSYFERGRFHARSIASCSYNGCEGFLPAARCGRAFVKRTPRG